MSLFKIKPGIKTRKHDKYDQVRKLMWIKCEACGKLVYHKDYKENKYICPRCNHTFGMTPKQRFDLLFDDKKWVRFELPEPADDPLNFKDRVPYKERLAEAREETGRPEALGVADGTIGGIPSTVAVMNGEFMMGSMGRAVGEGIVAAAEHAIEKRQPFIMVTTSGGARMQENTLSLMQMARATVAVNRLNQEKIPYIVVLADPTYGGVSASFAMLGDIHIAEQGARIGFAGRRIIEQNMREKLPSNFQTADYLYEHGMVDMVVKRTDVKSALEKILAVLTKQKRSAEPISISTPATDKRAKIRGMGQNTDYDKVMLARHENRPHFLDYINGLVSDWSYLAGDRLYAEDPAMGSGIGFFQGIPSVIIGQEKGRTIETRTKHRFGMANPDGYRKAMRMMKLAEKFDLPLISLVDTDGAFAGREGEERGQSQAVAASTQAGLLFAAPYISVITGTGGSGGAIAIATGDKVLMLENSVYSVIAPESASSILWKDNKFAATAAAAMKLTAKDMSEQKIIDEIVAEPAGGAQNDWQKTMENLGAAVVKSIKELQKTASNKLPTKRADKYLAMTRDV